MTTSDGVTLAYDDEGTGRPVVLLHGYSGNRANWEFQRGALIRAGHRVIALDARGHGSSQTPSHGLTMARLGQDTRELLEHLDLQGVALIGHSMGVSIALAMFSISGFDRIDRFVAIDQSPKIVNDEHWGFGVKQVTWANAYDCVHFRAEWGTPGMEPDLPEGSSMAEPWEDFDHGAMRKLLLDHFVADWRYVLPRIPVPTWVITGRLTNYYHPEGQQWFADQVPGSTFSCFEKSGHSPHATEIDEFNRQLLEFLRR
jgi:pimeloyl-ACP methyl ester carboxylesterase